MVQNLNGIIYSFYTYINARIKELALYLLLTYVVRSSTIYLSILFEIQILIMRQVSKEHHKVHSFKKAGNPFNSYKTLCKFGPQWHNGLRSTGLLLIKSKYERFAKMN